MFIWCSFLFPGAPPHQAPPGIRHHLPGAPHMQLPPGGIPPGAPQPHINPAFLPPRGPGGVPPGSMPGGPPTSQFPPLVGARPGAPPPGAPGFPGAPPGAVPPGFPGAPQPDPAVPAAPPMSETEMEEHLQRNKQVSSNAISRAVQVRALPHRRFGSCNIIFLGLTNICNQSPEDINWSAVPLPR